jgi:hypothetical protein
MVDGVVAARSVRRLAVGCVMAAVVVAPLACSRTAPEALLEQPTVERLAAKPNAVGVPYGRYVLIRFEDQLYAIEIRALSVFGERVAYEWYRLEPSGGRAAAEPLSSGRGEAEERPYTGRISIPDGPSLIWSKGSRSSGWLYWPDQGPEVAFYSHAFDELQAIDPYRSSGRWLNRAMFDSSGKR